VGELDCPRCGTHNLDSSERCRLCGGEIRPREKAKGPTRECPLCKTPNDIDAPLCIGCGKPLGSTTVDETAPKKKREKYYDRTYVDYPGSAQRTARTGLAGILLIMGAFFAFVDAIFTLFIGYQATQLGDYDQMLRENPELKGVIPSLVVCESVRLLFIVMAFMGGILAVRRLRWGFAMLGGVMGVLALLSGILFLFIPFWGLIELILVGGAVVAVGMIGISRREFMLT